MTKQRAISLVLLVLAALFILFLCSRSGGAETDYSLKRQIEALAARIGTLETRVGKLERAEKDAPRPTARRRYPWEDEEEDATPTPAPTPRETSYEKLQRENRERDEKIERLREEYKDETWEERVKRIYGG